MREGCDAPKILPPCTPSSEPAERFSPCNLGSLPALIFVTVAEQGGGSGAHIED